MVQLLSSTYTGKKVERFCASDVYYLGIIRGHTAIGFFES